MQDRANIITFPTDRPTSEVKHGRPQNEMGEVFSLSDYKLPPRAKDKPEQMRPRLPESVTFNPFNHENILEHLVDRAEQKRSDGILSSIRVTLTNLFNRFRIPEPDAIIDIPRLRDLGIKVGAESNAFQRFSNLKPTLQTDLALQLKEIISSQRKKSS